jgi:hypothetical protein
MFDLLCYVQLACAILFLGATIQILSGIIDPDTYMTTFFVLVMIVLISIFGQCCFMDGKACGRNEVMMSLPAKHLP